VHDPSSLEIARVSVGTRCRTCGIYRNLAFTKARPNSTPYQVWHGIKPDVSHLREFGAPLWVLLQGPNVRRKMLPKSQRRAYVGYDDRSKSFKYYNAATGNILTSRIYKLLHTDTLPPPEEIVIDPPDKGESSPSEGEGDGPAARRGHPLVDHRDRDDCEAQTHVSPKM